MVTVKAVSLRQPYAQLLFEEAGPLMFTRPAGTDHRGPLFIHSSTRRFAPSTWPDAVRRRVAEQAMRAGELKVDLPVGVILGCVELVDCVPIIETSDPTDVDLDRAVLAYGNRLWFKNRGHTADVSYLLPFGNWEEGRFAWVLDHKYAPRRLDRPVPCTGNQAMPWTVDDTTARRVCGQMEGAGR